MRGLTKNLFDFEKEETAGEVIFARAFELFVILGTLELAWSWAAYIRRISDVVLPLGIAQYVDVSFMFGSAAPMINAAAITALCALGFLRVTRYGYLGAFLLLHLQYAARYCLGEIPHSANMLGITLLAFALGAIAFDPGTLRRRFTLGFTYFFVGLGYTLAAYCKLVGTGPFWSDGVHLWMWVHEKAIDAFSKTGVFELDAVRELVLGSYVVATAFLTIGWLTEFGAFLMWWKRWRLPVGLAVIGLHVGIYLIMGIVFRLAMIELVLLAFPWARWVDWGLARARAPLRERVLDLAT